MVIYKSIDKVFIVFAMRRSGHHAITQWIQTLFDKDSVFYNDVDKMHPFGANPHTVSKYGGINNGFCDEAPFPTDPKVVIWNYEDFDLTRFNQPRIDNMVNMLSNKVNSVQIITVMRDPFNQSASNIKRWNKIIDIPRWKQYAEQYLNNTYIPEAINFDYTNWMDSEEYNKEIFKKLEGKHYSRRYNKITQWGESSFKENKTHNVEDFNTRWKWLKSTEIEKLIKDEEIKKLCYRIYDKSFLNKIYEE